MGGWKIKKPPSFTREVARRAGGRTAAAAHLPHRLRAEPPRKRRGLGADRQKTAFLPYCVCRGDHWSPANLPQQRIFRDSSLTRQTGAGEQCSPLQEFFDSLALGFITLLYSAPACASSAQAELPFACPIWRHTPGWPGRCSGQSSNAGRRGGSA